MLACRHYFVTPLHDAMMLIMLFCFRHADALFSRLLSFRHYPTPLFAAIFTPLPPSFATDAAFFDAVATLMPFSSPPSSFSFSFSSYARCFRFLRRRFAASVFCRQICWQLRAARAARH